MITVLLVDDMSRVRQGLWMRLSLEPDIAVVGEAANGAEALALAVRLRPDVILMDAQMPVLDGIAATEQIHVMAPQCAVVMLSLYDDPQTRAEAARAGAVTFVAKQEPPETLLAAIRHAAG
jgi:DNA-binding NarL/FixJ family response regulator